MTSEFERDMTTAREELDAARAKLLDAVRPLSAADLETARRGGWTVRRVLEHVIESEWLYGRLVAHLRDLPAAPGEIESGAPSAAADAVRKLTASREALLAAVEGVDEEPFYRIKTMGHEEYSVLSVLENVSLHDHEHADQLHKILSP